MRRFYEGREGVMIEPSPRVLGHLLGLGSITCGHVTCGSIVQHIFGSAKSMFVTAAGVTV
jgi:hypothetical protein